MSYFDYEEYSDDEEAAVAPGPSTSRPPPSTSLCRSSPPPAPTAPRSNRYGTFDKNEYPYPYIPCPRREAKKPEKYSEHGWAKIASNNYAYLASTGSALIAQEPSTYKEALAGLDADKWIAAVMEEHQSIQDAGVWEIHDPEALPKGRKAIGSRWVIKVKYNPDGSVERYKARLVVKGYSQQSGIDYDETFAPVSRYDSLRFVLSLAAMYNLDLQQLDIKTAFLNGILTEEIWMHPPPGIGLDGKILLLKKALYGLKQVSHRWYK